MSSLIRAKLDTTGSLPEGSRKRSTRSKSTKKKQSAKKPTPSSAAIITSPSESGQLQSLPTAENENIIFAPNPGPQTAFLAAADREVLYGGAAGGGKSYAMLADPLRYLPHPQFSGLLLRHTTEELRELIWKSQELYPKIYPGIKWS